MSKDRCGGMEYIPITKSNNDAELNKLWLVQHKKYCSLSGKIKLFMKYPGLKHWKALISNWKCSGWHFTGCPDCNKC